MYIYVCINERYDLSKRVKKLEEEMEIKK